MYEELTNLLRRCGKQKCKDCEYEHVIGCVTKMNEKAADAIAELTRENESLAKSVNEASEILRRRWIPVTERLPKYGDWVLGIGPKKGFHVCEYRGISHFVYGGDTPWFSAKGRSISVTHWMPLPEPPKEET